MKKSLLLIFTVVFSAFMLSSCFFDTLSKVDTFTFQLPLIFDSDHFDKAAPDTSLDFTNLNDYKEYRDNKDKIEKAEILHFNYWVDSLVTENGPWNPNDPSEEDIEFEFIKFYLQFADFQGNPDPSEPFHLLGEFHDVNVEDYYRNPEHILEVPEEVALVISEAVKENPFFYIITEYSKLKGQTEEKFRFPFIHARYDMVIRFDVKL